MKQAGRKIAVLTAYDYAFARILDQAGADVLLVGDSLGMVIQGRATTLGVTLDEMIYHARAVGRGAQHALVACDLPFGSYQRHADQAMRSAARVLNATGCQAIKLEGGLHMAPTVRFLVERGIPVIGHVGLTPQSVHVMGGFKIQGRGSPQAQRIRDDAQSLDEAGICALVLEGIPAPLAGEITRSLAVPTIGIGAGPQCDGQVLVCHDLLGLSDGPQPRFVKQYLDGRALVQQAASAYIEEVRAGTFPTEAHSFSDPTLT
jgi:3-methyl-2-oxobutanoate hydroxymethyltransferase